MTVERGGNMMATHKTGRAAPIAAKASGAARANATTSARPPSSATVKPPSAAASTASAAGIGQTPQLALRPPLEKALDSFSEELRAALDRAAADTTALRAEVSALRAELDQLRQRHAAHTHTYQRTLGGAGGHQWIELRFLQDYIDGEKQGYTQYGIWAHGKSGSDQPAEQSTSGPSS
jgi:hypothetical protein